MFKEYLLSAKSNNIPVSIYTNNEDTEVFSFGFVQEVSDDWVLLASISQFGFYNGFIIEKYEDVYRCESQDKYSKRMHKLYLLRKQKHPVVNLDTDNLIRNFMLYAQKNQLVVSIELLNSDCYDIQGFIGGIQDDLITIEQLDNDGNDEGQSVISFENITCVYCDEETEGSIKILADNR